MHRSGRHYITLLYWRETLKMWMCSGIATDPNPQSHPLVTSVLTSLHPLCATIALQSQHLRSIF
jgi:hypothetical protein